MRGYESADFATLGAEHTPEAVVALPGKRDVYKAGRCVVSNGAFIGKSR